MAALGNRHGDVMDAIENRVPILTQQILELRLSIAQAERDIARKELELFKLASTPHTIPVVQRGAFPKMVRDFMDTINGDSFRARDVFQYLQRQHVDVTQAERFRIRSFLSQEHRNGRLCKTLTGYRRPT